MKGMKKRMTWKAQKLDAGSHCSCESHRSVVWRAVFRYLKDCHVEEELDSVHLWEFFRTTHLTSVTKLRGYRGEQVSLSVFKAKFTIQWRRYTETAVN